MATIPTAGTFDAKGSTKERIQRFVAAYEMAPPGTDIEIRGADAIAEDDGSYSRALAIFIGAEAHGFMLAEAATLASFIAFYHRRYSPDDHSLCKMAREILEAIARIAAEPEPTRQ